MTGWGSWLSHHQELSGLESWLTLVQLCAAFVLAFLTVLNWKSPSLRRLALGTCLIPAILVNLHSVQPAWFGNPEAPAMGLAVCLLVSTGVWASWSGARADWSRTAKWLAYGLILAAHARLVVTGHAPYAFAPVFFLLAPPARFGFAAQRVRGPFGLLLLSSSAAFLLSIEYDDAVTVGAGFMLGAFLAGFALFGLRLDRRPPHDG